MGPPAAGAPVGRALRRGEGRLGLPDRLGAHRGGNRCTPGAPEGRSMHPLLKNELVPARVRPGQPRGCRRRRCLLLEPLEPSGRHADHDARSPTRGRPRPRSAPRATTSSTCGGGRRSPRSCTARSRSTASRGGRGAVDKARELDRRRMEPRRVPRGHAVARTVTCSGSGTAPSRLCLEHGIAAVPIAILGAYPGDAEGPVLAAGRAGPPSRSATATPLYPEEGETHQDFSRRMTQAVPGSSTRTASTWWESLQRAERGETPSLAGPQGPDWLKRWEGSRPLVEPRRREDLGVGCRAPDRRRGAQSTLVEEAIRQFGREGYNGASLDQIADGGRRAQADPPVLLPDEGRAAGGVPVGGRGTARARDRAGARGQGDATGIAPRP